MTTNIINNDESNIDLIENEEAIQTDETINTEVEFLKFHLNKEYLTLEVAIDSQFTEALALSLQISIRIIYQNKLYEKNYI
jgi:hypothetical protein